MADPVLLAVENLRVAAAIAGAPPILDDVSFAIGHGEIFGLAGESGSGKTTITRALVRLLAPGLAVAAGRITFAGRDVLAMTDADLRSYRWRQVSLVPQDAMSALNPVLTVGEQLADPLIAHERLDRRAALVRAAALLDLVGLDRALLRRHPHQLSGGMRQRVVIAMALALRPALVVMDEPTSALDVLVAHDLLAQIGALEKSLGFSVLLVGHDLGVMFELCARIAVLKGGRVIEVAPARTLRTGPRHPYTQRLVASLLDPRRPRGGRS